MFVLFIKRNEAFRMAVREIKTGEVNIQLQCMNLRRIVTYKYLGSEETGDARFIVDDIISTIITGESNFYKKEEVAYLRKKRFQTHNTNGRPLIKL